jgi:hypothetical protein
MAIDLNREWTNADVAALLGSVRDDRDWRLEVDKSGMAALHDKSAPTDAAYDQTLHCFLETWHQGTDFVGPSAASDKTLVAKIAQALRDNFPNLKAGQFVFIST